MVSLVKDHARISSDYGTSGNAKFVKECNTCFWENSDMVCTHKERNYKKFDAMYESRKCWVKFGKKGKKAWMIEQKESVK